MIQEVTELNRVELFLAVVQLVKLVYAISLTGSLFCN